MSAERTLDWAHGRLTVQRLAAMLAPVVFRLPDGRNVSPLHVAPWAGEAGTDVLPGILQRLRGEWPCVPFGHGRPQALAGDWAGLQAEPGTWPHGESSNREWDWAEAEGALALTLDHAPDHPISRLERVIRPDPLAAAVHITLTIHPRMDCRLPIGLHPVFRVPDDGQGLRLDPGPGGAVLTFPGALEPGISRFLPAAEAPSLAEVPLAAGGHVDASRLPLPWATEELLQVAGASGHVALDYPAEGFRTDLTWDPTLFPGVIFWLSNRGRTAAPWSGRHLAVGVEPVAAAFDLGTAISAGDNPIARRGVATAVQFLSGQPVTTRYRISVRPLPA
jgi:hypothetical protein